jgi:anti-sigma B factor antagonist
MASVDEMVRFRVRIVPDRECVIVALHGELDMVSVDAVQAALDELHGTGWTSLVLDLRELTFIDSTGLSLLLAAEREAQRVGAQFAIVDGSPAVARLLEIVGLRDHFSRTRIP